VPSHRSTLTLTLTLTFMLSDANDCHWADPQYLGEMVRVAAPSGRFWDGHAAQVALALRGKLREAALGANATPIERAAALRWVRADALVDGTAGGGYAAAELHAQAKEAKWSDLVPRVHAERLEARMNARIEAVAAEVRAEVRAEWLGWGGALATLLLLTCGAWHGVRRWRRREPRRRAVLKGV
jgi:hypothetical protein